MAMELKYEDIRRAAQEATQQLHGMMNDLRNQLNTVQQHTTTLSDYNYRFENLERLVQQFTQSFNQINSNFQMLQGQLQNFQSLPRAVADMQYRLSAFEKFANDMSTYFRQRQAQEDEEKGYQSVS